MHDAEGARLGDRHLDAGDGDVGAVVDVLHQHALVVHLVDVVAGEDDEVLRPVAVDDVDVLETPRRRCPRTTGSSATRWLAGRMSKLSLRTGCRKFQPRCRCRMRLCALYWVATAMRRMPEFSAFDEVEHRRDGVHAQAVDVVTVEPEQRARDEVVEHLRAPKVEHRGAPVRMEALPRVGVLVEGGAVEMREAVRVHRKVGGHPVEDHADAVLMHVIDEIHEIFRATKPTRRREVTGHLVSPRNIERMLRHRHQLECVKPAFLK